MFNYRIIKSNRRTIGITVSPETGVTVRVPVRASEADIMRFIESRSGWIDTHLKRFEKLIRLDDDNYTDGSPLYFRGKQYRLKVTESNRYGVKISGDTIEVTTAGSAWTEKIKYLIEKWYRRNAGDVIQKSFEAILLQYREANFSPARLTIRKMKRKWGSCSSKGRITINPVLIKLDDELHKYVILHELCHLIHPNHGKEFYNLLGSLCPAWKNHRNILRQYIN